MSLRIQLLGSFHVRTVTGNSIAFHQPRQQLLAGYLLLHADTPQLRSHLAYLFWPDSTEKQARTNLRKLLHSLRNIDPAVAAALVMTNETVCWQLATPDASSDISPEMPADMAAVDMPAVDVPSADVAHFTRSLDRAAQMGAAHTRRAHLRAAIAAYAGEFLPGHYDDWVLVAREQLHLRYVTAVEELVQLAQRAGDLQTARQLAQRLVQADRLQEASYRLLMGLHLELGEPASALRVYHTCATLLREELGVDPSPETHAFYMRILRAEEAIAPSRTPAHPTHDATMALVGRRAEWQQLRRIWQDAVGGKSQLVVIQGEAGIGKTRLAAELVETARKQGYATLAARAYAAEGRTAYGPIADLLRNEGLGAGLGALEPVWQVELARLVPELSPESAENGQPHSAPISEAWQLRRFHEALVRGCLAIGQPLLIHLDDLQWFDADSLGWLHFLLRFDTQAQLLVVATLRPEEVASDHPYHNLRRALVQAAAWHELALDALTLENVGDMASNLVGDELPAAATTALLRTTEGNPLFVVETLRALEGGDTSPSEIVAALLRAEHSWALTPRVQAVIQARLAHLSSTARRIIRMAAVVGRNFTFDLLYALEQTGEQTGDQTEATGGASDSLMTLVTVLDELWQRRIIREHGPNAYDFGHDRIREVVYGEISPILRRHLHAQVATTLETVHARDLGAVSSQVAAHFEAAGQPGPAAHYYAQAATYATERFALSEAVRDLHKAIALTPPTELAAHYTLRMQCEELYVLQVGGAPARYANLQELARIADTLYAQAEAGSSAHSAEVKTALARRAKVAMGLALYYSASGPVEKALSAAQSAVDLAQKADAHPVLAHALRCLGWSGYWYVGDMDAARRELTRAAELANRLGMDELEAMCLEDIAASGMYSGATASDLLDKLRRAYAIHKKSGNLYLQVGLMNKFSYIVMAQGEGNYGEALKNYHQALEIAQRIGADRMEIIVTDNMGIMYMAHGDYAQAEHWLQECRRIAIRGDFAFHLALNLGFLALLRANQGRLQEAVEYNQTSLDYFKDAKSDHRATEFISDRGYIQYLRQDYAAAQDYLQQALRFARANGDRRFEATALVRLGHVYLAQDQIAAAHDVYTQSYELRQALEQYRPSLEALTGLARIAWHEGRHAEARQMIDMVCDKLLESPLDYTEEAFAVYFYTYQILRAMDDPRAPAVYAQACRHLEVRGQTLTDAAARDTLHSLPLHRQFLRNHPPRSN